MEALIKNVNDFVITGEGTSFHWDKTDWIILDIVGDGPLDYKTKAKALWSDQGIYFLFDCEDSIISCSKTRDFDELYKEDVIEIFLWPDEEHVIYFEYEISPLGYELPLIVPNSHGLYHGWLPFKYTNDRRIISRTLVYGGEQSSFSKISGWKVEFFIPFNLLIGLNKCPPESGTYWRVNLCRLDYDSDPKTQWSWCPDKMENNFHNFHNFGKFIFKK